MAEGRGGPSGLVNQIGLEVAGKRKRRGKEEGRERERGKSSGRERPRGTPL